MFRNLSFPANQQNLRRRRHVHQDTALQHSAHFECPFSGSEESSGGLDLSLHHPAQPYHNRFSTLAPPPIAFHRDREYAVSGARRRSRNSRGTKEAKKRRDARRNRRKFAAQLLNEQLSRDIDETLKKANIHAPPSMTAPTPIQATPLTPLFQQPSCATLTRWLPPTPPQLPLLDFRNFDLSDLPYLSTPKQSSPTLPTPMLTKVPDWCPAIPSLMHNRGWMGDTPKFFDLSGLPERKEAYSEALQPLRTAQPRKQSRFFPSTNTVKPVVKLPQTSCKLHKCEQVMQDPTTTAWTFGSADCGMMPSPDQYNTVLDNIFQAHMRSPSAANLWSILASEDSGPGHSHSELHNSTWEEDCSPDGGVALPSLLDMATPEPSAIPYTHLNSLVGHANERGAAYSSEDAQMRDSAIYLFQNDLPAPSPVVHELSAMPSTPRMPSPEPTPVRDVRAPASSDEINGSTDHYDNEQQLFEAANVPLPESRPESPIDLATFLSLGHVKNCWCQDCEEAPEVVEEGTPFQEEDWTMWSMTDDESEVSSATAPKPATVTDAENEDELEVARHPCATAPEWNELFPCASTISQQPWAEPDFLGYLDDGMAFSSESDYDWV